MTSWMVLQLADSAFPTGGFAHSGGLEAALQAGELRERAGLAQFCVDAIVQVTHGALPIVATAFDHPERLAELDRFTRACTWSHVARRASRAQGRAWLDVAARSFELTALADARRRVVSEELDGHLAPAFGYVTGLLEVPRDEALAAFLHLALRGVLSAAVRLGAVGPTEAQALHHRLHPELARALETGRELTLDDVAQTAPLTEILQATQDRLYSRLFQS